MPIRQIDLNEIKAILVDPFQSLAVGTLSDCYHITTNGQGDGFIDVIEEVSMSNDVYETFSGWINEDIIHVRDEKTTESALQVSQFCDVWRAIYRTQPVDAAEKAVELGLV